MDKDLLELQLGRLWWVGNAVVQHGPYNKLVCVDVHLGLLKLEELEDHVQGLLAAAIVGALIGPQGSTQYWWVHDTPICFSCLLCFCYGN